MNQTDKVIGQGGQPDDHVGSHETGHILSLAGTLIVIIGLYSQTTWPGKVLTCLRCERPDTQAEAGVSRSGSPSGPVLWRSENLADKRLLNLHGKTSPIWLRWVYKIMKLTTIQFWF